MGLIIIAFWFMVAIALTAAYFISKIARKQLVKAGNNYAKAFAVLTFLGSFLLISIALLYLVVFNIRIER
jgi:hypothetical protein